MKILYSKDYSQNDNIIFDLSTVKNYLKIEHEEDDELLSLISRSVISNFEKYTNYLITKHKIECCFQYQEYQYIFLPYEPIIDIEHIYVIDYLGKKTQIVNYVLLHNQIRFESWYCGHFLKLTASFGLMPEQVPPDLQYLLLRHIAYCYEHRLQGIPDDIKAEYIRYKKYQV